jgi:transcriptional regulator with XRE-family HTH domain
MSLRGLAKNVGVTATAVHLWESGRRNPRDEHLKAFADAFKLTPYELLAGTDGGADAGLAAVTALRATESVGQAPNLAAVIASSKERIAAAAGISTERVRIVIEV